MPMNYTPDPTATQAPSAAPAPDSAGPTVKIPVDLEPADSASIQQAFKVLADYLAWEAKPRAAGLAYAQAIKIFRSAGFNERFLIDHNGFPGGRLVENCKSWVLPFLYNAAGSGSVLNNSEWSYRIVGAGNTVRTVVPTPTHNYAKAQITLGSTTLNDVATLAGGSVADSGPDTALTMEADFILSDVTNNRVQWCWGFCADVVDPLGADYALFFKNPATATFMAQTQVGGVQSLLTSTGVTPIADGANQMRIEVVGSDISDDGNDRALFFINGALVANIIANPLLGFPVMQAKRIVAGGASVDGAMGPLRHIANT